MPVEIVVCVKQVMDPETPAYTYRIDPATRRITSATGTPAVINGFDENAVEAALRIKDKQGANVTVLSVGSQFTADVMKRPLSMGADQMVLAQDEAFGNLDSFAVAYVLAEAIKKIGKFDLILAGRQASDWDNAQVPLALAEMLGVPCVTVAQKVEPNAGKVSVQRTLPGGYEVVEAPLPAVVTVSNALGEPRYANIRGIMAASRKKPTVWSAKDLGLDPARLAPRVQVLDLAVPNKQKQVEIITGDNDADAGRKLALKLREAKLI